MARRSGWRGADGGNKMDRRGSGPLWFVIARRRGLCAVLGRRVDLAARRRPDDLGREWQIFPAPSGSAWTHLAPASRSIAGSLVRAGRRPPRRGLPPLLLHQGHRAGGRLPRRRPRPRAGDAGARRGLRAGPPRPRLGPAGGSRWSASTSASGSSTWPRPAPPGATFERADAQALAFDAEFDAVVSLCQGAFGLAGGPGARLDGDGAVLDGCARALRPGGGWRCRPSRPTSRSVPRGPGRLRRRGRREPRADRVRGRGR